MDATSNIVLIGYRGTGKTSIARELAARLDRDWFDADELVEQKAGCTIKEIFASDGESRFRDLEEQVTRELMAKQGIVIATGGGVILRPANRQALAAGVVIWLKASPEVLFERIYDDPTTSARRPNLTGAGGLNEIREMLEQRLPLYDEAADFQVETESESPDQLASRIVSLLKSARG